MYRYKMHYNTSRGNAGSEELHLMPMTIREMNNTLSWWRKQGFAVSNLKIWRA